MVPRLLYLRKTQFEGTHPFMSNSDAELNLLLVKARAGEGTESVLIFRKYQIVYETCLKQFKAITFPFTEVYHLASKVNTNLNVG